MNTMKRLLALIFFLMTGALSVSLTLKAGLGVGPWDALAQTLSLITHIKIGTVGIILNSLCVLGQIIILGKNFQWKVVMQLFVGLIVGVFVNIIYYDLLASFELTNYAVRMAVMALAFLISGISVSAVLVLDIVSFCLEGICMVMSNALKVNFAKFRQGADVLFIIAVLALSFIFKLPLTMREGTIISMLVFGPLLAYFMPRVETLFKKYGLIEERV